MPRNQKPINLRVLDGNARHGEVPVKPATKADAPAALKRPSQWLDPVAKKFWKRILPELADLGILHSADRWSLECLSVSYSDWQRARQEMGEEFSTTSAAGTKKRSPAAAAAANAQASFHKQLADFGLTPASRAKLGLTGNTPADDDAFDALL